MNSAKPMAVVALLALAGVAAAQEKVDEQRIAELIKQLTDEKAREKAGNKLVSIGMKAAEHLLHVVESQEHQVAREAFLVLARMRPQANVIVPRFLSLPMTSLHPRTLPAFYRALADLTPYTLLDWDQLAAVQKTTDFIFEIDLASSAIPIASRAEFLREVEDEAWRLSGRMTIITPNGARPITVAPAERDVARVCNSCLHRLKTGATPSGASLRTARHCDSVDSAGLCPGIQRAVRVVRRHESLGAAQLRHRVAR